MLREGTRYLVSKPKGERGLRLRKRVLDLFEFLKKERSENLDHFRRLKEETRGKQTIEKATGNRKSVILVGTEKDLYN